MSLVEKYALLPDEIDRQSIEVVEASLPDLEGLTPEERYVVFRIVRAEGDPENIQKCRVQSRSCIKGYRGRESSSSSSHRRPHGRSRDIQGVAR